MRNNVVSTIDVGAVIYLDNVLSENVGVTVCKVSRNDDELSGIMFSLVCCTIKFVVSCMRSGLVDSVNRLDNELL